MKPKTKTDRKRRVLGPALADDMRSLLGRIARDARGDGYATLDINALTDWETAIADDDPVAKALSDLRRFAAELALARVRVESFVERLERAPTPSSGRRP